MRFPVAVLRQDVKVELDEVRPVSTRAWNGTVDENSEDDLSVPSSHDSSLLGVWVETVVSDNLMNLLHHGCQWDL